MRILRNIVAVIGGVVIGSAVNLALVMVSGQVIPAPEGSDVTSVESLAGSMHLFQPKHFLFPFLAHALGTLAGAFAAAKIAATRKWVFAWVIGGLFLLGGIAMVVQLPSPLWFEVLDLAAAYLPMAWIGGKLAIRGGRRLST